MNERNKNNTFVNKFHENHNSPDLDESSLIVTSSSSASSLESSVSMKKGIDLSLSSSKQAEVTIKNSLEMQSTHKDTKIDALHSLNLTSTSKETLLQKANMFSTKTPSKIEKETSRNVNSSHAKQANESYLDMNVQIPGGVNDKSIRNQGSSLNGKTHIETKNLNISKEKMDFFTYEQKVFPQGFIVPLSSDAYTKSKSKTENSQKPTISIGSNRQTGIIDHGLSDNKSSYSISGHLEQTILSSPPLGSVDNANGKVSNPPSLKIPSAAVTTVQVPSPRSIVSHKKKNNSVVFTPMSLNKLAPASGNPARPNQRGRSNSDSFTAIKSHKRTLTSSKVNVASNNHNVVQSTNAAPLRRGKWTVEEEEYVARVIKDFNSGFLNAPAGTTLRTYLSEKLHCDPMRITKKFTGDACIGKRVFHPALRCANNAEQIDRSQNELAGLENRWRRRLEMQQREVSKKSLASITVPNHTRLHPSQVGSSYAHFLVPPRRNFSSDNDSALAPSATSHQGQAELTQTAIWLDRSKNILSNNSTSVNVDVEIKEVEKLISEGPSIRNTLAAIPGLLQRDHINKAKNLVNVPMSIPPTIKPITYGVESKKIPMNIGVATQMGSSSTPKNVPLNAENNQKNITYDFNDQQYQDNKKLRRSFSSNNVSSVGNMNERNNLESKRESGPASTSSGEEDAEALVRFFNSVRQESYTAASKNGNRVK